MSNLREMQDVQDVHDVQDPHIPTDLSSSSVKVEEWGEETSRTNGQNAARAAQTTRQGRPLRVRKAGPGCIMSASEYWLHGCLSYTATVCSSSDAVLLTLRYSVLEELERSNPRSALAIHRLVAYSLARKNSQSKRQIQCLSGLYS